MNTKDQDFQQYRAKIRRKIMHRATRAVNSDGGYMPYVNSAWDDVLKSLVQKAITEVLEEELSGTICLSESP